MHIEYLSDARAARVTRGLTEAATWSEFLLLFRDSGPTSVTDEDLEVPWSAFLREVRGLAHLQSKYAFRPSYGEEAEKRLRAHVAEIRKVEDIRTASAVRADLDAPLRLEERGWDTSRRTLTAEQIRDLRRLLQLPHGADFSVPGSGKTTVLLALHLAGQPRDVGLLVVAPKNAFGAWDQAIGETMKSGAAGFTRLVGGRRRIEAALAANPPRMLITYSQLTRVADLLADYLDTHPIHLVLDESHKIKGGLATQAGVAAYEIAPFAIRRDILSGTPMPNALTDLANQFEFLFPAHGIGDKIAGADSPRSVVAPLYVRTTKAELGLPEPHVDHIAIDMSDSQRVLYGLQSEQALQLLQGLSTRQFPQFARTPVMRLLQAAIDPQTAIEAMVADDPLLLDVPIIRELRERLVAEELAPRMITAIEHARARALEGKKVVLWAPFTRTIQTLTALLGDLGAQAIYGAVPSGDETEEDTRESILARFHSDRSRYVLVANPAAGGEGISLHKVCHDAIFVGRTYNAAHFLQARDRIHRLGLSPSAETNIAILESRAPAGRGSIDLSVRRRLQLKVDRMAEALDDTDLRQLALEADDADPSLDDGLEYDDLVDLADELRRGT